MPIAKTSKKAAKTKQVKTAKKQAPKPAAEAEPRRGLTINEKKEYAERLYLRGDIDLQDIARIVGVSKNTMTKWSNDPEMNWKAKRKSFTVTKTEMIRRLYNIFDALTQLMDDPEYVSNPKDADALIKYSAAIKNLETDASVADAIEVFMRFNKFLLPLDPEIASKANYYQDLFIKDLLKRF